MLGHQGLLVPARTRVACQCLVPNAPASLASASLSPHPHVLDSDLNLSDLNLPLATTSI
jgi:hypothetical protein